MDALIRDFVARARAADAEVVLVPSLERASAYLKERVFGGGAGAVLLAPPLAARAAVGRDFAGCPAALPDGRARAAAGVVEADFGIAETGTLVRLEQGDAEKAAWTLPETCYCLLDAGRIAATLEAVAPRLRRHLGRTDIPSPQVSLVTGPSRTADIECQLTIGVHGPFRLVIVLIGGAGPAERRP